MSVEIVDKIFNFIIYRLGSYNDKTIFEKENMADLGAYYAEILTSEFMISREELIEAIKSLNLRRGITIDSNDMMEWICKRTGIIYRVPVTNFGTLRHSDIGTFEFVGEI